MASLSLLILFSCLHTAFVLQEALTFLHEKKKVYTAFLDVKAFNTVWLCLIVKPFWKDIPLDMWHL